MLLSLTDSRQGGHAPGRCSTYSTLLRNIFDMPRTKPRTARPLFTP